METSLSQLWNLNNMQVKFIQSLYSSARHLKAAEYLLGVTLKLMEDNRVLGKCLTEMQKSTTEIIDAVLYLESNPKDILPSGKEERAEFFFNKGARKFLENKEIEELKKILVFAKRHKESHLEFVRGEKLVLFGSKECKILTEKGLKDSIKILKQIILKLDKKTEGINTPFLLELFKRL
jgi:hypothetical protein